jgi:outer membrane protein TolC
MKIVVRVAIIAFFFTGFFAKAGEIGLDEYLELVKSTNPFFTKEDLSVTVEKKGAESLLGAQDWLFSVTPSYDYLGEASAPDYGGQKRIHHLSLAAGLNRELWSTGGRLGLGFSTGYTDSDSLLGNGMYFKHGFSASYTHPLLKNSKGTLDRLAYELSGYSIDLTEVRAGENKEGFLLEAAAKFLDWAYYTETVRIAEERLALAKEQLGQTEKKFKANLVDKVDVLRAEDAVRIAEQILLKLQAQWKSTQAELATLAGSNAIYGQSPSYDLYGLEPLPGRDEAVSALRDQSRVLRTFDILKEQLAGQREGLREQERAQLDLTLAGGIFGRDEEFGRSLELYKPDATVSVVYSKPIGNRTVRAQIEEIDLRLRQLEEEKQSTEISLESSLVSLLIQMAEIEKILKLNQAQIRSAEEKTKEEIILYNRGRSQLIFVIQSRDNEENAKLTYAENAALYHSLRVQYRAVLDELYTAE